MITFSPAAVASRAAASLLPIPPRLRRTRSGAAAGAAGEDAAARWASDLATPVPCPLSPVPLSPAFFNKRDRRVEVGHGRNKLRIGVIWRPVVETVDVGEEHEERCPQ